MTGVVKITVTADTLAEAKTCAALVSDAMEAHGIPFRSLHSRPDAIKFVIEMVHTSEASAPVEPAEGT